MTQLPLLFLLMMLRELQAVFKNSAEGNNSDTSKSVVVLKIRENSAKTKKIRPKRS